MNSYSSLRKQNRSSIPALIALVLCILLTSTLLFSRLLGYSQQDKSHYIPLTSSLGTTRVTEGYLDSRGGFTPISAYREGSSSGYAPAALAANPGFRVYDDRSVWKGETDIEIFRLSYENGEARVTVQSSDGDKLLAPGTENSYRFSLENNGNVDLAYRLDVEAYFSHGEYVIPVEASLYDYQNNYLTGSPEAKAPVLELNGVSREGTVKAGNVIPFTLEWEWPFEGNDSYDTMLGDLAVEEDISLTIVINTMATYTPEPTPDDDGVPKTGDDGGIMLMFAIMGLSLLALLLLIFLPKGKREDVHV